MGAKRDSQPASSGITTPSSGPRVNVTVVRHFLDGPVENFTRMSEINSPHGGCARGQALLIGPWDHILGSGSSEVRLRGFRLARWAQTSSASNSSIAHISRRAKRGDEAHSADLVRARMLWRARTSPRARTESFVVPHSDGTAKGEWLSLFPTSRRDAVAVPVRPRDPARRSVVRLATCLVQGVMLAQHEQRPLSTSGRALVHAPGRSREPFKYGPLNAPSTRQQPRVRLYRRLCTRLPRRASRILAGRHRAATRRLRRPSLSQPGDVYASRSTSLQPAVSAGHGTSRVTSSSSRISTATSTKHPLGIGCLRISPASDGLPRRALALPPTYRYLAKARRRLEVCVSSRPSASRGDIETSLRSDRGRSLAAGS